MPKYKFDPDYTKLYPGVHINDAVMEAQKKSDRKMKYQEYDLKRETWQIDQAAQTAVCIPSREDSYERLSDEDRQYSQDAESVEDMVIRNIMLEKLRSCLNYLDENDRRLIEELFYNEKTELEVAAIFGVKRRTIRDRRDRLLVKLHKLMGN